MSGDNLYSKLSATDLSAIILKGKNTHLFILAIITNISGLAICRRCSPAISDFNLEKFESFSSLYLQISKIKIFFFQKQKLRTKKSKISKPKNCLQIIKFPNKNQLIKMSPSQ